MAADTRENDDARRVGRTHGLGDWREPASGMLCAFEFHDGAARPLDPKSPEAAVGDGDWTWTHFRLGDVRAQALLRDLPMLPSAARELFKGGETRIQIEQWDACVFGILPDLERDLSGRPQLEGRLVFALDTGRLVTARMHPLLSVDDLRRRAETGKGPESPVAALRDLIEIYVGHIEDLLEQLGLDLGAVEDFVLTEPPEPGDTELSAIRRAVSRHRRELQALRSALARANGRRQARRAELLAERLGDTISWIDDVDREAGGLQERARLLHEEVDTQITGATNRSMRALTVISTLLIPPTLIVGAFGMNLRGMPFEASGSGFAWASGLCAAVVAGALWLLRRMRFLP